MKLETCSFMRITWDIFNFARSFANPSPSQELKIASLNPWSIAASKLLFKSLMVTLSWSLIYICPDSLWVLLCPAKNKISQPFSNLSSNCLRLKGKVIKSIFTSKSLTNWSKIMRSCCKSIPSSSHKIARISTWLLDFDLTNLPW